MNKIRQMILLQAREQYRAWLALRHTTPAERQVAEIALDEISTMMAEETAKAAAAAAEMNREG